MAGDLDFSELMAFDKDVGEVSHELIPKVRQGVQFAAHETKDVWQDAARGPSGRHARLYPGSISYEMKLNTDGVIGAEVGPVPGVRQGSLGILEEGKAVHAAPQHAGRKAAKVAEKELEIGVLKALKGLD